MFSYGILHLNCGYRVTAKFKTIVDGPIDDPDRSYSPHILPHSDQEPTPRRRRAVAQQTGGIIESAREKRPFRHWCVRTRLGAWSARYRRGVDDGTVQAVTSYERVNIIATVFSPRTLSHIMEESLMVRKSKKQRLKIIHPNCAGIDIGSREHCPRTALC
jgi:hypothetical protein